jgi:hypothetical protein
MADILITGNEIASNTNLLSGTRLETIPAGARFLHFRCSADLNTAAANYALTIELPLGTIPVDAQRVPANAAGTEGVLDERTLLQWTWPAVPGGRFIIAVVETGTTVFTWLAQLR